MKAIPENPIDQSKLDDVAATVLAKAKALGATGAEVSASVSTGYEVSVRLGEVDVLEHQQDKGVGVTVYFGQKKASASSSDTREESLLKTVEAACALAKYTSEDPCAGLAERELLAYDYPDLALYYPWDLAVEQAIELAREAEAVGMSLDKCIKNSEGFNVSVGRSYGVYANSNDFLGGHASSRHSLSASYIASKGDEMERDYAYTVARDPLNLVASQDVASLAAKRAIARLAGRKVKTGQMPVIFDAQIAPGLFGHFLAAIRGGNLHRKSSFLLDKKGKKIFADHLSVGEDPHLLGGLASSAFDGEGVRNQVRSIVQDGVLQDYSLSCYSARQLGLKTTGNAGGNYNIIPTVSNFDQAALLKHMGRGLLITEVMGQGVNIVTGDYSRGAAGFWVENGEIQYPVTEITIASNLADMFMKMAVVGCDINRNSSVATGSILIESMMVAGE